MTQTQINKINKAKHKGHGVTITMSQTQIRYNTKIEGGSLALLAGLLARAAPIAKTLGSTLGLSALSGAAQTGIQKLLGGGLYLNKKGHTIRVQSDGKGLFLYPANGKGLETAEDGLYLKPQGQWVKGKSLLLGSKSPLKTYQYLAGYCKTYKEYYSYKHEHP